MGDRQRHALWVMLAVACLGRSWLRLTEELLPSSWPSSKVKRARSARKSVTSKASTPMKRLTDAPS